MSTAPSLARRHLRNLVGRTLVPLACPSCSASSPSSSFHTASARRSAWPAGTAGSEDADPDHVHHARTRRQPRPSTSQQSPPSLRNRAGPAMENIPPSSSSSSLADLAAASSAAAADAKGKARQSSPSPSPSPSSSASRLPPPPRRKTIAYLQKMKHEGTKVACLTAYDYPTGLSMRYADVDLCLVGDSLANVALGHSTTQPLSLDAIIHHAQAVQRGLNSAILLAHDATPAAPLVFADMPFGTFVSSDQSAVDNVVRLMQQTGVDGVKIEGAEEVLPLIRRLTSFGIPVMGHLGLQPQRVGATSGYRVQGKSARQAHDIFRAAQQLERAGCFAIVLECIPNKLAKYISDHIDAITIGIGAGSGTDGQVLVVSDMMGELTSPAHILAGLADDAQTPAAAAAAAAATTSAEMPNDAPPMPLPHADTPSPPKFVRSFVKPFSLGAMRLAAVQAYVDAVRDQSFPDDDSEGYKIKSDEWRAFIDLVESSPAESEARSSHDA
ncbi:uncharacterized protein PFL1_05774 [Pseudozyma flocculosa PF-1]|uniref:3-methyl-2-oxobutanoate hydroxymethyltransferase n=2 Tax=Pseudozyma flocculosa TaxID=84751 RepID=A0A5C3F8S9_9BASI|nr:uncharacterized protein PFL1_05774 [Pseudozyma flocculosa PF-1]EPQ26796.1 hypothetical protein PFL1_05774 [Pseudozyma flocculosa PF-1]SPO40874.1 related to ECM31 - 3-methyl-2-oxobutanoate hydroxymethyltransferase [Pseudozyma flocculosa]